MPEILASDTGEIEDCDQHRTYGCTPCHKGNPVDVVIRGDLIQVMTPFYPGATINVVMLEIEAKDIMVKDYWGWGCG